MSDLPTKHEDTDSMELSTDNEEVRASVSDAATGLAQAKENRKLSNNSLGNNMLKQQSIRSIMGRYQRTQKENYN